jgi:hypothetical protein
MNTLRSTAGQVNSEKCALQFAYNDTALNRVLRCQSVDDASFSFETLHGTGGARRLPAIGTHTGSLLAVLSIFTSVFPESTECSNVRERVFESRSQIGSGPRIQDGTQEGKSASGFCSP